MRKSRFTPNRENARLKHIYTGPTLSQQLEIIENMGLVGGQGMMEG